MTDRDDGLGLRGIVLYKAVKAVVELAAALLLLALAAAGLVERLREVIAAFREHAAAAWTVELSRWLASATTRGHLEILGGALVLDGLLSGLEAWSLHRRYAWGGWLVIGATASLLPLELYELSQRLRAGRVILLLANLVVVGYLLLRRKRSGHF